MASEALNGSHMNELYKPKQDALMVMSLGSSGKPMVISSTVPVIFFGSWYFRSSLNSQNTIFLKQRISLTVKILSSLLVFSDSHIRISVIQFNFLSSILHFGLKGLFFLEIVEISFEATNREKYIMDAQFNKTSARAFPTGKSYTVKL